MTDSTDDFHTYGAEPHRELSRGPAYRGQCDGCPEGTTTVRDLTGTWGATTVCSFHEDHQ